jgi:hypothetical protein
LACETLDAAHGEFVGGRNERDGAPLFACPARAAYAMHVIFRRGGHVVIDNVRDRVNVNASRRDVRSNKYACAPVTKISERRFTLRLCAVCVNAVHFMLTRAQNVREAFGPATRSRKDKHSLEFISLAFEKVYKERHLRAGRYGVSLLLHGRCGAAARADFHQFRLAHSLARNLFDGG